MIMYKMVYVVTVQAEKDLGTHEARDKIRETLNKLNVSWGANWQEFNGDNPEPYVSGSVVGKGVKMVEGVQYTEE